MTKYRSRDLPHRLPLTSQSVATVVLKLALMCDKKIYRTILSYFDFCDSTTKCEAKLQTRDDSTAKYRDVLTALTLFTAFIKAVYDVRVGDTITSRKMTSKENDGS